MSIGNGRKRYSEIQAILGEPGNGLLDKQLKSLIDMETVEKTSPINRRQDKKKQFYEIRDNLMRFYFRYVFGGEATLANVGEGTYYDQEIAPTIVHFVSHRLEGITRQYFGRLARAGRLQGVEDFGSYWYDDPRTRSNGELDCMLRRSDSLDFFECKYWDRPMRIEECRQEENEVHAIPGVKIGRVGFVCTGGFTFESDEYVLVTADDLFDL